MKSLQLNLCFLFFAGQLFSQNENADSRYAAKIYNLSSFGQAYRTSGDTSVFGSKAIGNGMSLVHPTFAFQLRGKKGNYHELELINLYQIKNPVATDIFDDSSQTFVVLPDGAQQTATYLSFRYEYTMSFKTDDAAKMEFSLGFGINPHFSARKLESFTPTVFNSNQRTFGFRTFVIPRLSYFLTSKLFLDLNIPIAVTDMGFTRAQNFNPVIPEQQQTISNFNLQALPRVITCRIGVGLRL